MNTLRVDDLIAFCMATAALEDNESRWLGEIHLLKYLYLADLAWAKENGGQTFTGAAWQFYHFGPWAGAVYQRLQPSLESIHASKRVLQSYRYAVDQVRWCCPEGSDELRKKTMQRIPVKVQVAVQRAIRKYGADTSSLLHHVYTTGPMLKAAPGERLDFQSAAGITGTKDVEDIEPMTSSEPVAELSTKAMKKRKQKLSEIREQLKKRLSQTPAVARVEPPAPRYDDVYEEGVAWLDSLVAEEPLRPEGGSLRFSEDVWKSRARTEGDVP